MTKKKWKLLFEVEYFDTRQILTAHAGTWASSHAVEDPHRGWQIWLGAYRLYIVVVSMTQREVGRWGNDGEKIEQVMHAEGKKANSLRTI